MLRIEPYLRSYSRLSPKFMEPEGSLHHLKQPATCTYLEPDESSPHPLILLIKNNFNIILHLHSYCTRYLFPLGYFIRTQYVFIPLKPPITQTVFGSTTKNDTPHYATFSIIPQHQILEKWPSLNVTDHISHPHKAKGKITFLSATVDNRAYFWTAR